MAQASEQLTQCQLQLELERRQVQSMATDRDNMKRWSQNAASDVMRVMEQLNKKVRTSTLPIYFLLTLIVVSRSSLYIYVKPHVELNNQVGFEKYLKKTAF